MPRKVAYPGVYIKEIPSGIQKILPVPTSISGMVGSFAQGPTNVPSRINSWKSFCGMFGGVNQNHVASYSIKQFFDNGGSSVWVVRTETEDVTLAESLLLGLRSLAQVDVLNILFMPETQQLDTRIASKVIGAAINFVERFRAMYILDPPLQGENSKTSSTILSWVSGQKAVHHPNVAMYTPRIQIRNSSSSKLMKVIPPSGTIAGLWARFDNTKGVWKAPAGTEAILRNVYSLENQLTNPEMESLANQGVNALRRLPSNDLVVWGARTLSTTSEWRYIPVRRLALFIESSLQQGTNWVVFEPNDAPLWLKIRQSVETFLDGLYRQGAFQGQRPQEAYFVKCGTDTMTAADRQAGIVNIIVGFAPLKPAEFVIVKIQKHAKVN